MSENKKDTLLCVFVRISVRNKLKNVGLTSFKMPPMEFSQVREHSETRGNSFRSCSWLEIEIIDI